MAIPVDAADGKQVNNSKPQEVGLLDRRLPHLLRFLPFIVIIIYMLMAFSLTELITTKELAALHYIDLKWIITWTFLQAIASASISTILGLPIGIASGFYLSRTARLYRILGLPVFMAPTVAVILGFSWLENIGLLPYRLYKAPLGIILVHSYFNIPLAAILVEASILGASRELLEYISSLRLPRRKLASILFRLSLQGAVLAWLISFTYSFVGLATPLMIPGAPYRYYTLEAWIYTLFYGFLSYRGLASLLAIVQAVILLLASLLILQVHAHLSHEEIAEQTWRMPWKSSGRIILSAYSGILLVFLYVPLLGVFLESLHGGYSLGLEAYRMLFEGRVPLPPGANPMRSLFLSLIYALLTALFATLLGVVVGLGGLTRRLSSMISLVISPVMAGMGAYFFLYKPFSKIVGSLISIIIIVIFLHTVAALPLSARAMEVGLKRLPRELIEYIVSIDLNWNTLLRIIIRIAGPSLTASFLLAAVTSLGEFGATLVVTDPRTWSLAVLSYELYSMGRVLPEASAAASILLFITIIFTLLTSRKLKEWF